MNPRRVRAVGRPTYGRPQPLRTPRRRRNWPQLGSTPKRVLALVIVCLAVLWGVQQLFSIHDVTVTSPGGRGPAIEATARQLLKSDMRQGSLLLFNADSFSAALLKADPMIKQVEVRRHWPHGVSLNITLKQPSLGWSSGNQAYVLDRDGAVIGELAAGSTLPLVLDDSNLPVTVGSRVTTARFVTFASDIANRLPQQGIGVTRLEVRDTTLDMYVTTDKGYRLILDTSRPAADELSDLKTILTALSAQKKTPVEYIDLRIAGKAYYK